MALGTWTLGLVSELVLAQSCRFPERLEASDGLKDSNFSVDKHQGDGVKMI